MTARPHILGDDATLARVDKALSAVIEAPGDFTDFEVDFATSNADRIDEFGILTRWSLAQWKVVEEIEKKINGERDLTEV
jgi:hypothetical protein